MRTHRIALAAAAAALTTTGAAAAVPRQAPRLADAPFLGRISGGAAVNYQLTRTPGRQTVTIAGRNARVRLVGTASDHEYTALVNAPGFRSGRKYRVVIRALSKSGTQQLTFSKVLYMHRSLNRP
jgi:hypothetical protein